MSEHEPGTMQGDYSERVEQLFERALELAPPERVAFLEQACGGDAQLLQELRSLLDHREAA